MAEVKKKKLYFRIKNLTFGEALKQKIEYNEVAKERNQIYRADIYREGWKSNDNMFVAVTVIGDTIDKIRVFNEKTNLIRGLTIEDFSATDWVMRF